MKVGFSPRAVRDLESIADHLKSKSPTAARKVRSAILETIRTLALFPNAGRMQSVEGVRKLVTRRYSYLIYYSVDLHVNAINIITIQHPSLEREFSDD